MKKVERKSLEIKALDALREAILSGQYKAGERLTEMDIAHRLGLSRGTIRTALHQLAAENLVVQIPYTGWHIVGLSEWDIWELSTLRAQLDALGAQICASLPSIDKASIEKALDRLLSACQSENAKEARKADWEFHKIIAERTGHRRLMAQYQLIEHQWLLYAELESGRSIHFQQMAEQHQKLTEAIIKNRPLWAAQIAQNHNLPEDRQFYRHIAAVENPVCVWPGLDIMEEQMINHISIGVHDLPKSKLFYEKILSPLGMICSKSTDTECYFGTSNAPVTFVLYPAQANDSVVGARAHVALNAPSSEAVDEFDRLAEKAGAKRLHPAGRRPDLGDPTYYGAMIKDLDGHVIEILTSC